MKKFLRYSFSVLCASLLTMSLYGQEAPDIVNITDFTDGLPPNATSLDLDGLTPNGNVAVYGSEWTAFSFNDGSAYAVSNSWFTPAGQADDWLIFQDIAPSSDALRSLLTFDARSFDVNFLETMEIQVDVNNTAEPDSFELVETVSNVNGGTFATYSVDLSEYAGDTISIAFRNISSDEFLLGLDNINLVNLNSEIFAGTSQAYNNAYVVEGTEVDFNFNIRNLGTNEIQSMSLEVSNGVSSNMIDLDDVEIATYESELISVSLESELFSAPGNDISVSVNSINGTNLDTDPLVTNYSVISADDVPEKLALAEMFTASSCPPCEPGNNSFHSALDGVDEENIHFIKYQQNFPGIGDPYTTDELVERRVYYGINSIPNLNVNGQRYSINPIGMTTADYTSNFDDPGFVTLQDLVMEVDTAEQTVSLTGSYTVLSDVLDNTKLMIAIHEGLTFNNETSNGETEFEHVVKKLIGGVDGMEIDPSTPLNEPQQFEASYTFNGDYRLPANGQEGNRIDHDIEHSVEEFSDLLVSAWIENQDVRYILNSGKAIADTTNSINVANLVVNNMNVFPSPASDNIQIDIKLKEAVDADIYLTNMNGQRVQRIHSGVLNVGENTIKGNVSELPTGRYTIELRGNNLYKGMPLMIVE